MSIAYPYPIEVFRGEFQKHSILDGFGVLFVLGSDGPASLRNK